MEKHRGDYRYEYHELIMHTISQDKSFEQRFVSHHFLGQSSGLFMCLFNPLSHGNTSSRWSRENHSRTNLPWPMFDRAKVIESIDNLNVKMYFLYHKHCYIFYASWLNIVGMLFSLDSIPMWTKLTMHSAPKRPYPRGQGHSIRGHNFTHFWPLT